MSLEVFSSQVWQGALLLTDATKSPRERVLHNSAVAVNKFPSSPSWLAAAWQQALSVPLLPTILSGKVPATLPENAITIDDLLSQ